MRSRIVFWAASCAAMLSLFSVGGCQAGLGDGCEANSDCSSKLVCNQFSMRCAEPALICENDDDCANLPDNICGPLFTCEPVGDVVESHEDIVESKDLLIIRDLPQADFSSDVDLPECPELPATMLRATTFVIGTDGMPGNGLDIDGKSNTCAPEGQCDEGIDNAAAILGQLANGFMAGAVKDRQLNVLFTTWPAEPETCPFLLLSRSGEPVSLEAETTAYRVVQGDESGNCATGARFEDACVSSGTLEAGRYFDAEFPLALNVMGMIFRLPLHQARIVGTAGESWDTASFLLGGWIRRDELMDAIDNVPAEQAGDLNPAGVKTFITSLEAFKEDLDTNGDEIPDALSTAIIVELELVTIEGFAE